MQRNLAFILFLAIAVGCQQAKDIDLKMINKSKRPISVMYNNDVDFNDLVNSTYNNIDYQTDDRKVIMPDSIFHSMSFDAPDAWHEFIEGGKEKKLFVYFFYVDTLEKYNKYPLVNNMTTLIHMHKYIRISKYSEQYLIDNNWTLTFR